MARALLGRRPACGQRTGPPRLTVEVTAALLLGALAARVHPGLVLAAACWLAACAVPLVFVDAAVRRLPDPLTVPAYAGTAALLLLAAAVTGPWSALLRAALGGLALAGRYPGRLVGTIGDAGLPSPDSLVIIIGRTPAQLAGTQGSVRVTSIATAMPGSGPDQGNPKGLDYSPPDPGGSNGTIDLILIIVALAILTPVLIFIATATRLSAARREQR